MKVDHMCLAQVFAERMIADHMFAVRVMADDVIAMDMQTDSLALHSRPVIPVFRIDVLDSGTGLQW